MRTGVLSPAIRSLQQSFCLLMTSDCNIERWFYVLQTLHNITITISSFKLHWILLCIPQVIEVRHARHIHTRIDNIHPWLQRVKLGLNNELRGSS